MGREIDRQQEINSNYYRSKDSKVMVHAKTIIKEVYKHPQFSPAKRAPDSHIKEGEEEEVRAGAETTLRFFSQVS
jgi:hypothetical protein